MEVVASDRAGDIEDFSAEVEAGDDMGGHCVGIDFIKGDASRDDFSLFEDDFLDLAEVPAFEGFDEAVEVFF